jgi:multicomponent K+:H+ antiporter subunit A
LLLLLVFWELTSLVSFLLIGYWKHDMEARQGARLALFVTGGGGLALFAGILLLGHIVGSFALSDVLQAGAAIKAHPLYNLTLVLILLGAFTKSAQFPFHFWLPHAMAAPTPISSYLHSATMVKAGIFLLARLFPALSGTETWFMLVGGAGAITLVMGAYHALWQHDIKGLLAYSTISHLGLITLLFGLGTSLGAIAGVFHVMNHAVFKASLFMATGIIDHETGTRDMRKINGLFKYMPYTAVLAIVAAGAMAGVPLLNGFISKEMFFQEAVDLTALGFTGYGLPAAAVIAGIGSVAYSSRFIHDVFFNGEPIGLTKMPHEPPRWMKVPIEFLVVLVIAVGGRQRHTTRPPRVQSEPLARLQSRLHDEHGGDDRRRHGLRFSSQDLRIARSFLPAGQRPQPDGRTAAPSIRPGDRAECVDRERIAAALHLPADRERPRRRCGGVSG